MTRVALIRHDARDSRSQSVKVSQQQALRAIAMLEAAKGILGLVVAVAAVTLLHHDLHRLSAFLSMHARLHPDGRLAAQLLRGLAELHVYSARVALAATAYSCVRFTEAWGLWRERAWAAWLGAASAALYVPFELHQALHRPGVGPELLVVLNIAVVAFLLTCLARRRAASPDPQPGDMP